MRLLNIILIFFVLFTHQVSADTAKTTYGYIEKITLSDQDLTIRAKLDTGARSSSLHAIHIKKEKIKDKTYLRFTVPHQGGKSTFLCEYYGRVSIKARAQEIEHITRPVVLMKVKLGEQEKTIRVNLTNRANFLYPFLLGRQGIIAFNGVVDPSTKYQEQDKLLKKPEAK